MSKKRFANVWAAIEDAPAQAENMKLRSALTINLCFRDRSLGIKLAPREPRL